MASLGENIAALRVENGLTQVQLGEKLCVSAQAVSKWERNLSQPDIVTMRKMAALFGVTIESMLDEDGAQYEEEYEAEEDETYEDEEAYEEEEESESTYVCTSCGKICEAREIQYKDGKALCAACLERALAQERRKRKEELEKMQAERAKKEEEQRRQQQYRRAAAARQLHKSLILAGVATALWLITYIITCVTLGFGVGASIAFGILSLYAVFAAVFELSLPQSLLRSFYTKLFPRRQGRAPSRGGCAPLLLFLLFGIIFILLVFCVIVLFVSVTGVISMVTFPPDFRSCRRASLY